jgi:glycosyltransferase involved in cell wall biosynthesis
LQALLDDPAARQQLSARAKLRADALYRWDAIARKYEKVFERLIKR